MSFDIVENFERLKPHLKMVDTRLGDMVVYKLDNTISFSLQLYGEYSHAEIVVMSRYLNKDSTVLDIGTNIGYHARAFHKETGCKVLGFEPHPDHFTLAGFNCQNMPVKIINAAVSNKNTSMKISGFDMEKPTNYGEVQIVNDDKGTEVPVVTIDSIMGEEVDGCDLMKIDTEGQELNVLKGARKTINKFRPVIFYEAIGEEGWQDTYDHLQKLDYKQYWVGVRVKPMYFKPYRDSKENPFGENGVTNILAVPEEHELQPDDLIPVLSHESYNSIVAKMQKYILVF